MCMLMSVTEKELDREIKKTKEMNFRSKQNIKFLHAGDQKIGNVHGQ